nr:MAG TPA: hypothetical protein [Caudoviricetes sp.]
MDLKKLIEDFSYLVGGEPSPEVTFHDGSIFEVKDGWGEKAVRISRYYSKDIPESYFKIEYDRYKKDPEPVVVLTTLYDSVEFLYKVLRKSVETQLPWENRSLRGVITQTLSRFLLELDKQLQPHKTENLLSVWEWVLSHMWTYRCTNKYEGRFNYGVAERRLAIFPGKSKRKVMELGWVVSPLTIELAENERGEDFSETASLLEFKGGSSDWQIWLPNKVHVFYDRMTLLQRRILEEQLFPKEEEKKEEVPVSKDSVEDISAMEILKKNIENISSEKVISSLKFDLLSIDIKRLDTSILDNCVDEISINISFFIDEKGKIIYKVSALSKILLIKDEEFFLGRSYVNFSREEAISEVLGSKRKAQDFIYELTSQIGVTRKEEVQREIIKNILEAIPNVLLENKTLGGNENEK